MTTSPRAPADADARTWPFWAPSDRDAVDEALDLAGVAQGVRLVDLGCGDGQVLALAAARGALVEGIEADPDLVVQARANLDRAGIDATIIEADLLDPDLELEADVFFAYLAPATLQRLLPRLRSQPGVRSRGGATLVTVDFEVPGLTPSRRRGRSQRYRLPGRARRLGYVGWPSPGTLVATVPDVQSLTVLSLVHPSGATTVRLRGGLAGAASVLAGADRLPEVGELAVDLRWEGEPERSFVGGTITTARAGSHAVFAVFGEDEGVWELDDDAVRRLRGALRRTCPPTTVDEALAVAEHPP